MDRQAEQILNQIHYIQDIKDNLTVEETRLRSLLQKACDHPSIERGGGEPWQDWPNTGHHPYFLRCRVCGLYGRYPSESGTEYRTN